MNRRTKWIAGGALAAAVIAGSSGFAIASGRDADKPLTGSNLEKAVAAALAHTGGGSVTETEAGDDGAAYGVEVRLPDGSLVEVNLDANFQVIGQAVDDGSKGQGGSPDD